MNEFINSSVCIRVNVLWTLLQKLPPQWFEFECLANEMSFCLDNSFWAENFKYIFALFK